MSHEAFCAYLNSEAELAAVLGHEIGHVTARHSVQQSSAATAANVAAAVGGLVAGIFVPQLGGQLAQGVQSLLGVTGSVFFQAMAVVTNWRRIVWVRSILREAATIRRQ